MSIFFRGNKNYYLSQSIYASSPLLMSIVKGWSQTGKQFFIFLGLIIMANSYVKNTLSVSTKEARILQNSCHVHVMSDTHIGHLQTLQNTLGHQNRCQICVSVSKMCHVESVSVQHRLQHYLSTDWSLNHLNCEKVQDLGVHVSS